MFNIFNRKSIERQVVEKEVRNLEEKLDRPAYKRSWMQRKTLAEAYVVMRAEAAKAS